MATIELTIGDWAGPSNEAHELTEFYPSGNVRTRCRKMFPIVTARTHVSGTSGQLLRKCATCIRLNEREGATPTVTASPVTIASPATDTPKQAKGKEKGKKVKGGKKGKEKVSPALPLTNPANIPPMPVNPPAIPVAQTAAKIESPKSDADVIGTWAAKDEDGTAHFMTERIGNVFKGACGRSILNGGKWHEGGKHCQRCTSGKAADVVANWGKASAPSPVTTTTIPEAPSEVVKAHGEVIREKKGKGKKGKGKAPVSPETTVAVFNLANSTTPEASNTVKTNELEGLDLLISEWNAELNTEERKLAHYEFRLAQHRSGHTPLNKSAHRNMRNGMKNSIKRIYTIKRTIGALKDFDAL